MGKILLIVGCFYHTFFTEKSKENFQFSSYGKAAWNQAGKDNMKNTFLTSLYGGKIAHRVV